MTHTPGDPGRASETPARRPTRVGQVVVAASWRQASFLVSAATALLYVLFLHGFVPGSSQVPLTALSGAGSIKCLHDQGVASLWTWCMSLGLPIGAPRLTGLPEVYTGWLLSFVPGVNAWAAHQLSSAAFVAIAFAASYALLRRWNAPRWIAVLTTTAYLTALNVVALNGFEYTFLGYILLPAYVYAAIQILGQMEGRRWARAAVTSAALCIFMVFTDGYSFFSAAVVICCLFVAWVWRSIRTVGWRRVVAAAVVWSAAGAGAAVLYSVWVPDGAFRTTSGQATFAALSVDLVSLFVPSNTMLYTAVLGIDRAPSGLWGPPQSIDYNYLGYVCLLLGVAFLVASAVNGRRARTGAAASASTAAAVRVARSRTSEQRAVAVAGAVALFLSFGPVLKIGQTVPELSAAALTLPTAWAYAHVPGISELRAVQRWLVVTRWSVIVLAGGGLTLLWRRWRGASRVRGIAIVIVGILAMVEISPDIAAEVGMREQSVARVAYIRDGIVAEAATMLRKNETIYMLPTGNDFLANYLVPMTGVRSYNVGVDKNFILSAAHWPASIVAASVYGPGSADLLCAALKHDADAIVLPYMSPYFGPLLHDNDPAADAERKSVAQSLAQDPRFTADVGQWLTVLRGAGPACSRSR